MNKKGNTELFSTRSSVVSSKEKDLGLVTGTKYQTCIIADGVPHYSASFFGNDEYVERRVNSIKDAIRSAVVEVKR